MIKEIKGFPAKWAKKSLLIAMAQVNNIYSGRSYFTELSAAGGMYYNIPPLLLGGSDFEIELEIVTYAVDSSTDTVIGGTTQSNNEVVLDSDPNNFRFFAYVGGTLQTICSVPNPKDNKLHTFKLKYTGTTASLQMDDGTPSTQTWALNGSQNINFIGQRSDGRSWDNIIRNLRIWTGGDRTTGTLARYYKLNEQTGTVVRNYAAVLGSELVTNGTFDTDTTGWSAGDAGTTINSVSSVLRITNNDNTPSFANSDTATPVVGKTYLITGNLVTKAESRTGGRLLFGGTDFGETISVGSFRRVVTASTTSGLILSSGISGVTSEFSEWDNISVREAPGYGSTVNITDAERSVYRQDADGNWINKFWPNLWAWSENFNGSGWNMTEVTVTSDDITAPDGTTTADKLIPTTNNALHYLRRFNADTSKTYSLSIYAKDAGYDYLYFSGVGTGNLIFNVNTGVIETLSSWESASITDVGNGWYKCEGTVIPVSANEFRINSANNASGVSFTGDGTSGTHIWGAQLEEGSKATPYRPTTDTAGRKIEVA